MKLVHQPLEKPQPPPGSNQSCTPVFSSQPRSMQQKSSTPNIDNKSNKFSPPITNLTNTKPQNLGAKQQLAGQPTKKVGNQSLNLEKSFDLLGNARNIGNVSLQHRTGNLANLPNLSLQQQIELLNQTSNSAGLPYSQLINNLATSFSQIQNFPKQQWNESDIIWILKWFWLLFFLCGKIFKKIIY